MKKSMTAAMTSLLPLLLAALCAGRAPAETFLFTAGEPNLVRFESKAPLETFDGKTRQVKGSIDCDPASLADSVSIRAEVDMATLDTGIEIRNQHMRENHLDTKTYPVAVFRGGRLVEPSARALTPGRKVTFFLEGMFSLHGVTRPVRMEAEAELLEKDGRRLLHAVGRFQVKLADYEIPRPRFLVMKLDEIQRVTVEITAEAQ